MNEVLIKELVKFKLNAADALLDSMPSKVSEEIRSFGKVILESVNESCKEMKEKPPSKAKPSSKIDNVVIE
jgi:hypothetical protein